MSFMHQVCKILWHLFEFLWILSNFLCFFRWSSHSSRICELFRECSHVYLLFDFHIQTKCHVEEEYDSFANRKFWFLKKNFCYFFDLRVNLISFVFTYIFRFNFLFCSYILHMVSCSPYMTVVIQKLCLFLALHKVYSCWSSS